MLILYLIISVLTCILYFLVVLRAVSIYKNISECNHKITERSKKIINNIRIIILIITPIINVFFLIGLLNIFLFWDDDAYIELLNKE